MGSNGDMNAASTAAAAAASSTTNTSSGIGDFNFPNNIPVEIPDMSNNFTWEMIGLGLEEPLPPQETIDEL